MSSSRPVLASDPRRDVPTLKRAVTLAEERERRSGEVDQKARDTNHRLTAACQRDRYSVYIDKFVPVLGEVFAALEPHSSFQDESSELKYRTVGGMSLDVTRQIANLGGYTSAGSEEGRNFVDFSKQAFRVYLVLEDYKNNPTEKLRVRITSLRTFHAAAIVAVCKHLNIDPDQFSKE